MCAQSLSHVLLAITLESILEQGFHKEEGPFVKGLDSALATFHVQTSILLRSIFGKHVHRTLKVGN